MWRGRYSPLLSTSSCHHLKLCGLWHWKWTRDSVNAMWCKSGTISFYSTWCNTGYTCYIAIFIIIIKLNIYWLCILIVNFIYLFIIKDITKICYQDLELWIIELQEHVDPLFQVIAQITWLTLATGHRCWEERNWHDKSLFAWTRPWLNNAPMTF